MCQRNITIVTSHRSPCTCSWPPLALKALKGGNFGSIIDGQDLVLHLITDNIYMDIKFTSWKSGKGGGFSYERSTDQPIATKEF